MAKTYYASFSYSVQAFECPCNGLNFFVALTSDNEPGDLALLFVCNCVLFFLPFFSSNENFVPVFSYKDNILEQVKISLQHYLLEEKILRDHFLVFFFYRS